MAPVRGELPNTWLAVVGGDIFGVSDGYSESLRALPVSLGLADRVVFTGHLEDVRPALAALDVFVHSGAPEPFGLVNAEAMAAGKPVVAFGHGALPELVVHGETGILVSPGDEEALGQAVISLLRDPAQRNAMGAAGRARVEAHFTVQQMAEGVETVLQGVDG
jgi:glycosyltransferase involved in cell wall biosynthesis